MHMAELEHIDDHLAMFLFTDVMVISRNIEDKHGSSVSDLDNRGSTRSLYIKMEIDNDEKCSFFV